MFGQCQLLFENPDEYILLFPRCMFKFHVVLIYRSSRLSPSEKSIVPSVLDFVGYSQRARDTLQQVKDFITEHIYPRELVS